MNDDNYKAIAENAKRMFLPPREQHGQDTTQLANFIDELTALHQKYSTEGQSIFDSSHVLLEMSISTMMKMGHADSIVSYMRYVKSSGDSALKAIEQHSSLMADD